MTVQEEPRKFAFKYNSMTGEAKEIYLNSGEMIFVLGANGAGKSGLMTQFFAQNSKFSKRISAHRQTWFNSNSLDFTPATKSQYDINIRNVDTNINSRWKDDFHAQRSQVTIFNLINAENVLARKALTALRTNIDEAKKISKNKTPIELLNQLLTISNIPIKISVQNDEKIFATKNGGPEYSIAQLSDGERNAILIASDVLTAEPNTLFIIDEPERHLHRSIISPLLTELFQYRRDCAFMIATHDLGLPLDNPDASVLVVRNCKWNSTTITGWDTDLILGGESIDYHVKQDILGARRVILFVEGSQDSLDQHIYRILFPEVSVVPQGNCVAVEQAVKGISATASLNWVRPYGLVDSDDRQEADLKSLEDNGIYALPYYSVESLYYCEHVVKYISNSVANLHGGSAGDLLAAVEKSIIEIAPKHRERLCARLSERKVKEKIQLPSWKDIMDGKDFSLTINLKSELDKEIDIFNSYIQASDSDGIIKRYPVRETPILTEIAKTLKFQTRLDYENSVRKALIDDEEFRRSVKTLLGKLSAAIET